jgi:hypothetical protein
MSVSLIQDAVQRLIHEEISFECEDNSERRADSTEWFVDSSTSTSSNPRGFRTFSKTEESFFAQVDKILDHGRKRPRLT